MNESPTPPRVSTLAFIAFGVNAHLDRSEGDLTFPELYRAIEEGRVLEVLHERFGIDHSLFPAGSDQHAAVAHVLRQIAGGLEGRERRKLGVERSGLHLLLGFLLEALQQPDFHDARAR